MKYDVIVIGGGAAGLMCAIEAGKRGRSVLVLEHNDRLGKKILISGGGRCNFTNINAAAENYLSGQPHFCKSALARYTPGDFTTLVEQHGIPWHEKKLGQLFCDFSSRQIVDMLLQECQAARVEIRLNCTVQSVLKNGRFQLETTTGACQSASLVIGTGGLSFPKLGATDLGYRIAQQFGMKMSEPRPGLVPLTFNADDQASFGNLSGISIDAEVTGDAPRFRENILFTHRGLSGPAILQISNYWLARETDRSGVRPSPAAATSDLPESPRSLSAGRDFHIAAPGDGRTPSCRSIRPIHIDLVPDQSARELLLAQRQTEKELKTVLGQVLPQRFVQEWCARFAPSRPMNRYSNQEIEAIASQLHNWEIRPAGTEGYAKAEVTMGGVDTAELSSKTMESRRVPGLYFIGEVVDVTGWLGGYNFQWAWASGHAAGQAV